MNSKRINNIFTPQGNLSRKDIDTYRETSDEKVKHSIEEKALASDFDSDTLEGWSVSPVGTSSLKSLDRKFAKKSSRMKWIIAGSIVIFGISMLVFSLLPSRTTAVSLIKGEKNGPVTYEKTDLLIPEAIEEMKELPKKEQILIATIQKDYSIQQKEKEQVNALSKENATTPIDNLPVKPVEETKIRTEIVKKQTLATEIYLEDLKLVDYRNYRSRPTVTTKQIILNGTPASLETENSKEDEISGWKEVEVPYMDYIDKSMGIFAKGNNKKALSRFEVILATYPMDINANFYGGLCYFNLQEYGKAISTFEKCLNSEFTNFNEEAEWYLAKSYLANGQKEKAISLFTRIKENNGYYATPAGKY